MSSKGAESKSAHERSESYPRESVHEHPKDTILVPDDSMRQAPKDEVSADTNYDSDSGDDPAKHHISFSCMDSSCCCVTDTATTGSILGFLETSHQSSGPGGGCNP